MMNGLQTLRERLEAWETQLETPIIAGEMTDWLATVRELGAEVDDLLQHEVATLHAEELRQMVTDDPELSRQFEILRARDEELRSMSQCLMASFALLENRAERVEPDELKVADPLDPLVKDAINFIIEVRKQEAALQVWTTEALTRDRGVGD